MPPYPALGVAEASPQLPDNLKIYRAHTGRVCAHRRRTPYAVSDVRCSDDGTDELVRGMSDLDTKIIGKDDVELLRYQK